MDLQPEAAQVDDSAASDHPGGALLNQGQVPFTYMWSPTFVPKPADWPSWCVVAGTYSLKQGGKSFDASKFEALSAWLRSGPPPIFVGFGSMVIKQPEELASMIVEAARRAQRRVLVQSGWSKIDVSETTSNGDDGQPLCFNVGPAPHDWLLPQVLLPLPVGAYTPPSLLAPHDWLLCCRRSARSSTTAAPARRPPGCSRGSRRSYARSLAISTCGARWCGAPARQDGQGGRLGEAIAGLHGLISLRLEACDCPPHS